MATEVIEGTIEEAVLKRSFFMMQVYNPVVIRRSDGEIEDLGKRIAHSDLGPYLTPGQAGRFYLYSTIDHRGIHGIRDAQGESLFAFARNNEISAKLSIGVGILLYVLHYWAGMPLSGWAPILLIIGIPGLFIYWKARQDAQRQFDEDQHNIQLSPAGSAV